MSLITLSMYWIIAGTIGWAIMLVYRLSTDGLPKNITIVQLLGGFTLACIAGFFVFPMIGIILIKERYES